MSTTFQINKVYSNENFRKLRGIKLERHLKFYVELYSDHPEDCPWPKVREEYRKHINGWKDNMVNFIIPVKRTNYYIIFSTVYNWKIKKKIRTDVNGNEYVIVDNVEITANDISKQTSEEAKILLDNEKTVREYHMRYIDKLQHLEEYGYVYLSDLKRVESIEELNAVFGV